MSAIVRFTGLRELIEALTHAPAEIKAEGMEIMRASTEGCASEVRAAYEAHRVTGTLARRVKATFPSSEILVGIVQSTAPHSHIYEFGRKPQPNTHTANQGAQRAANIIVPIAQRHRRQMYQRVIELLERRGFHVGAATAA